jgi:hypothetical protein
MPGDGPHPVFFDAPDILVCLVRPLCNSTPFLDPTLFNKLTDGCFVTTCNAHGCTGRGAGDAGRNLPDKQHHENMEGDMEVCPVEYNGPAGMCSSDITQANSALLGEAS